MSIDADSERIIRHSTQSIMLAKWICKNCRRRLQGLRYHRNPRNNTNTRFRCKPSCRTQNHPPPKHARPAQPPLRHRMDTVTAARLRARVRDNSCRFYRFLHLQCLCMSTPHYRECTRNPLSSYQATRDTQPRASKGDWPLTTGEARTTHPVTCANCSRTPIMELPSGAGIRNSEKV